MRQATGMDEHNPETSASGTAEESKHTEGRSGFFFSPSTETTSSGHYFALFMFASVLNFHPSGFFPYSLWLWPILSFRFPSNLFSFCGKRFWVECAWWNCFAMKQLRFWKETLLTSDLYAEFSGSTFNRGFQELEFLGALMTKTRADFLSKDLRIWPGGIQKC